MQLGLYVLLATMCWSCLDATVRSRYGGDTHSSNERLLKDGSPSLGIQAQKELLKEVRELRPKLKEMLSKSDLYYKLNGKFDAMDAL